MVQAAYRLFCERGYSVPLTAIAEEADVAVQTLYFTFGTKLQLFTEAFDFAVLGDDQPIPPDVRWAPEMEATPDGRRALEVLMQRSLPIYQRVAPLWGIFQTGEPEIVALRDDRERLRYEGFRHLIDLLARKGGLKPGISRKGATDILYAMLSPELYRSLVTERGWFADRWRAWMTEILAGALLEDGKPRRRARRR